MEHIAKGTTPPLIGCASLPRNMYQVDTFSMLSLPIIDEVRTRNLQCLSGEPFCGPGDGQSPFPFVQQPSYPTGPKCREPAPCPPLSSAGTWSCSPPLPSAGHHRLRLTFDNRHFPISIRVPPSTRDHWAAEVLLRTPPSPLAFPEEGTTLPANNRTPGPQILFESRVWGSQRSPSLDTAMLNIHSGQKSSSNSPHSPVAEFCRLWEVVGSPSGFHFVKRCYDPQSLQHNLYHCTDAILT